MPRNMSCSFTTEQAENKTKTVTRRLGWWFLKAGDIIQLVEKAMGLKRGEKIKKIHLVRIKSSAEEPLCNISRAEVIKEGFPHWTTEGFIRMFCANNKCGRYVKVNRIEWVYL